MQSYHMGSSKFIKLLKDAEIIGSKGEVNSAAGFSDYESNATKDGLRRAFTIVDADIIFKKYTGLNNKKLPYNEQNQK